METRHLMGAALVAWFSAVAVAQDPTTQSRMTAAYIAESRGDHAAALRELEAGLAIASESERAAVKAAIERLRGGGSAAPTRDTQQPTQDPIRELIEVLNRGTTEDAKVHEAFRQLEGLGALAVSPLLEQLPQLGPFGLKNALELLDASADPRIAAALISLLAQADSGVVVAIAQHLDEMDSLTALPIAAALANGDYPPEAQLPALKTLLGTRGDTALAGQLVQKLLANPATHARLMTLIEAGYKLGDEALQQLIAQASGDAHVRAQRYWLLHRDDLTEEAALATLLELPAAWRGSTASSLAARHLDWVHVGIAAITAQPPDGFGDEWFTKMEWWRDGDAAAKAIVEALPAAKQAARTRGLINFELNAASILTQMVASGWRLQPELESAMITMAKSIGWGAYVNALPIDGEARARSAWRELGPQERYELVRQVVQQQRPWHRLIVEQFAALDAMAGLRSEWIERDWRGIDAETTQLLAETVASWQAKWPALDQRSRNGGSRTSPAGPQSLDWRRSLCDACFLFELPTTVLQPLLDAHDAGAWQALRARDPQMAFELAANWPDLTPILPGLVEAITTHGDAGQMELLARAIRSSVESRMSLDIGRCQNFVLRFGSGSVPIIALGSFRLSPVAANDESVASIAMRAAYGARVTNLDVLLQLLPDLHTQVAEGVVHALKSQLNPGNASRVAQELNKLVVRNDSHDGSRRVPPQQLARWLLEALTTLGAADALPIARMLLERRPDNFEISAAVLTLLALTKTDRQALLTELLADDSRNVVSTTLGAPDIGSFVAMRPLVEQAILRHCEKIDSLDMLFENLDRGQRLTLAASLVGSDSYPRFSPGICDSILRVLGAEKNGDLAQTLGRAATHPDSDVRRSAAEALGRTFTTEAVPFLIDLLRDDEEQVRNRANQSLADIANYLEAKKKWGELLK